MLKYLSKFASDILPSVAATIIGAYIVNHYITNKPTTGTPAAVSSVDAGKAPGKNDAAPAEGSTDVANLPASRFAALWLIVAAALIPRGLGAGRREAGRQQHWPWVAGVGSHAGDDYGAAISGSVSSDSKGLRRHVKR